MNERLIRSWNAVVRPGDTIYVLGDFGFSTKSPLGAMPLDVIFALLHGHKHLVRGNHDERNPAVLKLPWESQNDLVTLREGGVRAVACHYALETWKGAHRGYLMLHGHSHGNLKRVVPHRFDVGVECFDRPVSLLSLAAIAAMQRFEPQDHHGDL